MKQVIVETLTDEALVQAIASAQWRVRLYTPGVSMAVAQALIAKAKELRANPSASFLVALDVSDDAVKMGYGEAAAIELLWGEDTEHSDEEANRWFYFAPEIRIGLLIVDDHSLLFSPLARLMEAQATLAKPGPNGITLPYELLLKEEYQQRLEPLAKRHVSLEDIEHLTQIPTETREEMEEKVKAIEAEKAELKAQVEEQKKALENYKKEVHQPLLHGIKFSVKKFKLERLTLKAPQDLVKEVATNSNKDEIDLHIRFSEAEVKDIFEGGFTVGGEHWTLEKINQAIEAYREEYLFGVSYTEKNFINPKKCIHRHENVILKEHEEAFREKIKQLNDVLQSLKFEFKKKIEQKVDEKIERIFNLDPTQEKNIFDRFSELKASLKKFDPEIDVQLHSIDVKVLDTTTFQVGLFDALAKKHLNPGVGYDVQKDKGWNVLLENGVMDKELRVDRSNKRDYDEKDKRDVIKALYENYRNRLSVESTTKE